LIKHLNLNYIGYYSRKILNLQRKYDELLEKYKKLSERENLFMVDSEQCKGITKKGYRCGQKGLPNQGGGHIIHGYCEWHR
tara:strand:- start:862 stop:1104 length:243 start_codon:yes stop_codon:yes gene_type:complete